MCSHLYTWFYMLNRSSTNNDSFISFLVLNTLAGTSNTMFSNDNESKCLVLFNIVSNAFNTIFLCVLIMYIYILSNQKNYDKCFPRKCLSKKFLFTSQLWPSQFRVSSPG